MSKAIHGIRNFYAPAANQKPVIGASKKSPVFVISRVQFERIRQDMQTWREAVTEAENAWYPHRVRMQRIFLDTILNEHVEACIKKRKNLTLLRDFKIADQGGIVNEEATNLFKKPWFEHFQSYCIDAKLFGYNLIKLGDIINDSFPALSFIKRQNVSPDRYVVGNFVYSISGQSFTDPEYADWYIFVSTPTETGSSPCGYGLLYKIAKTEIIMRNNIGQNADFNEVYGQPIRKGTTSKQNEERDEFEGALRDMGSNAYIILDEGQDTLELVTASNAATGYQTYDNLEQRCEKKVSKVLLGHADALDSTPGKLGSGQDGKESPTSQALLDTQSEDGRFIENIINEELLPRMRKLGFLIPDGHKFSFLNDEEKEEFRKREDESNQKTATLMKTIKDAGGDPDWDYFNERTGMNIVKSKPEVNGQSDEQVNQDKIESLKKQLPVSTGFKKQSIANRIKHLENGKASTTAVNGN